MGKFTAVLLLSLVFTAKVFGQTFVCNQPNFIAKFNAPKSTVKAAYEAAMFGLVEKWFKQVKLEPKVIHLFEVKMIPDVDRADAAFLQFQSSVTTAKGVTYKFKLNEHVFVAQGNDPLDNSILTCGPNSGLPFTFRLEVFDIKGNPVNKMIHDFFWGDKLCYRYTLAGLRK